MKRTRALLLLVVALFSVLPAVAQFRYAPIVGVNINDLKFKQDLFGVSQSVGAQLGVQGELMFPGIGFGMDLGLIYNEMGAKTDLGSRHVWAVDGFGNENVMLHTLQVPLHVRFKWTRMNGLEEVIAPFVYGGPDFSICVAHSKIRGNAGTENPFRYAGGDLGLSCGGGFELWKKWQVSVQYTWGMTYVLKTRVLDNLSARNRQWSVRVAYYF